MPYTERGPDRDPARRTQVPRSSRKVLLAMNQSQTKIPTQKDALDAMSTHIANIIDDMGFISVIEQMGGIRNAWTAAEVRRLHRAMETVLNNLNKMGKNRAELLRTADRELEPIDPVNARAVLRASAAKGGAGAAEMLRMLDD